MNGTLLIIDLEATCWEKSSTHKNENEIIEIGAVVVDGEYNMLGEIQRLVRPVRNPILSDFCTELTSITQSEVDSAEPFPRALDSFRREVEELVGMELSQVTYGSWGDYDRKQFLEDCKYHGIPYPFGPHRNLKREFAERKGIKPATLKGALRILEIPFEGTHHRGLDDARNIARILRRERGSE
jgi:inhibitor of KinA sporulation pathway (predicted exonuclease)